MLGEERTVMSSITSKSQGISVHPHTQNTVRGGNSFYLTQTREAKNRTTELFINTFLILVIFFCVFGVTYISNEMLKIQRLTKYESGH